MPEGLPQYFQFTAIFEDTNEILWLGSYNGGLHRYNPQTNNVKIFDIKHGLAHNFISTIKSDYKGRIWVGTWGGGISVIENNKINNYNHTNGLVDQQIRCIIEDREGNILIGTNENGIAIFKGERFISFTDQHGLLDQQISSVFQDNKGICWIGTKSGINILRKSNGTDEIISLNEFLNTSNNFNKEVLFIREDKNNNIWLGTKEDGVYSVSVKDRKIDYNPKLNFSVNRRGRNGIVTAMTVDHENALWIGTIDGIIYFNIDKQAIVNLSNIHGIAGNDITALFCDSKNTIWISSKAKGITRVDDTVFTNIGGSEKLTVKSFTEDGSGTIWAGTESQGIYNIKDNHLNINYKQKDGLLANYITLIVFDKVNSIWIGTNKGLNRLILEDNRILSYTEKSGFTGIEVKDNASFVDADRNIWFGSVQGIFKYIHENDRINELEPLTHITKMSVNHDDRVMLPGMVLNYPEKAVIFNYNSICLSDPDKVQFQVMLEGADNDWQPPTKQTFANYTPLPAGSYVFKVRASNNNGIWNEEPITFEFTKKPPFWKTKLFYFIILIIVSASLVSFIKIRERNLKIEKAILEKRVKERTKEVVEKNKELATKNQNIMDSINYAKRIQQAMLPDNATVKNYLKDAFILFKPKDIVSGDFYWIEKLDDKIIFSAVDCTGHGVPGALMSVVGYNGLHRIVGEFKLSKPSDILNKLNELVKETLQSSQDSAIKDGMDMALCVLDREKSLLEYAGAFNPIYIISKRNELIVNDDIKIEPKMSEGDFYLFEIKGSKQPIGAYYKSSGFSNHTIKLQKDDAFYVFSDGYADQFGGPKGKKFMYKQFKMLLLSIQNSDMESQKNVLNNTIENWMNESEQIDDICLIGVKV
ncbi:two-component regulator propeller domain-containing protein [Bacteroidota bacterium]